MTAKRTGGMSLLELLLAVSVLGIIVVSVGFMFVCGLRAWGREDRHSELLNNNQMVVAQISNALEGARRIIAAEPRRIVFSRELGQAAGTESGIVLLKSPSASWGSLNGRAPQAIPAGTAIYDIVQLSDTTLLAAGSDGYVYRSTDSGQAWVPVKLGDATEVRDIVAADDATLYAGTASKGDVYKSADGGLTWANTGELAGAVTVRRLAAASDGTVWAGTDWTGSFNVFRSTDAGVSWTGYAVISVPAGMWAFRMPIDITNGTNRNLNDYQVRIPVAFIDSKMQPDFSDLRFRDTAGTDLPFWVEACDPGISAIVWVKVPRIGRRSTVTIYMYYGNPGAASASDITTTMDPAYTQYNIPYEWTDKVSGTSIVSADDGGLWVDLPYQFPYWREFQDRIYACSNGYLSFGSDYGNDNNAQRNNFRRRSMIAPFWEDLRTDRRYGSITDPGIFADHYQDHSVFTYNAVSFRQWRAGPVRYRAQLVFQVLTYRNGDVKISYQLIRDARRMDPVAGVSKGDNSNYIEISSSIAQGASFLFGIRQYVDPEPTVVFGEEESLATGATDVLSLILLGGTLYAGTSSGEILVSNDGGVGWTATSPLPGASFVHRLYADCSGIIYAGTEPAGAIFRTNDQGATWVQCQALPGADQVKAIGETFEKRLICGACPTGLLYTSVDSGDSWSQLPAAPGVTAVYCFQPVLNTAGFSWSGNIYQDTGNRGDMVLRDALGAVSTVDNGFTSDLGFEYFKADMTPADISTPQGIAQIATVRLTVESKLRNLTVSDSLSITLRNSQ